MKLGTGELVQGDLLTSGPVWCSVKMVPIAPRAAMMHMRLMNARERLENAMLRAGARIVLFDELLIDINQEPVSRVEDGSMVRVRAVGWP